MRPGDKDHEFPKKYRLSINAIGGDSMQQHSRQTRHIRAIANSEYNNVHDGHQTMS
jgi:hypothetical protein